MDPFVSFVCFVVKDCCLAPNDGAAGNQDGHHQMGPWWSHINKALFYHEEREMLSSCVFV
jgi:hypothetical protein